MNLDEVLHDDFVAMFYDATDGVQVVFSGNIQEAFLGTAGRINEV